LVRSITLQDDELLRLLSERDPTTFKDFFYIYFPILCRYAEKILHDPTLAQDIVQETFIKFWKDQRTYASVPEMKGFLYTVTRNGCLNLLRGREREEQRYKSAFESHTEADVPDTYDEIARLEYLAAVYRVVKEMPEKMRAVFLLSYEEGLSIAQIAAKMKISIKTVRNQKYRSLQLLRSRLGNQGGALLLFLDILLK